MILLEGFDCSGKTTLGRAIQDRTGYPLYMIGPSPKSTTDLVHSLRRCEDRFNEQCIQDRCTQVSESVYSMLRTPDRAAMAMRYLHQIQQARVIVYCRPPKMVMIDSLSSQMKDYDTASFQEFLVANADHLITIYDAIMQVATDRFFVYDRTVPHALDRCVNYIMGTLNGTPLQR